MKISIVIPIYNESENLSELFQHIQTALSHASYEYEIIAVDDSSRDESFLVLKKIAQENSLVRVLRFMTNYGQTAALSAGIAHATGDIIVPIDADLENDPADIPKLIEKIEEGYDVVSGWRKNRWKGNFFTRKLPSLAANKLISFITRVPLHDYGCTLKAYRAEVLRGIQLYGEMHRFIPAYAAQAGARVVEVVVQYTPRKHGKSNYGVSRTYRVLLDLLFIKFSSRYMNRPLHFFGGLGIISLMLGIIVGLAATFMRIVYDLHLVQTPLPVFSALLIIVGVQLTVIGILAEILMRTYYESQRKTPYVIREKINP